MNAPCLGCTDRTIGCHSKCDNYKKYRSIKDKGNKVKKDMNNINWKSGIARVGKLDRENKISGNQ